MPANTNPSELQAVKARVEAMTKLSPGAFIRRLGALSGPDREALRADLRALLLSHSEMEGRETLGGILAAIRALRWSVAVHNDYRLDSRNHTFWLFTKGERCCQAECPVEDEVLALSALHTRLFRSALNEDQDHG